MSVLYLLITPPPVMEGTDAVYQEVHALRREFQGEVLSLSPFKKPGSRFPRQLYGLHNIRQIKNKESHHEITHVYSPVLHFFPFLYLLRNPIVFTVAAGLHRSKRPAHLSQLSAIHRIVVSNERDAAILREWGLSNYSVIPPGIDTSQFNTNTLELDRDLTLLMGSAPWAPRQFDLKGIDVLLEATARLPYLKLILLWRGMLFRELSERVERHDLGDRIEIVNHKVKANDYLKRAHASILLAKQCDIAKSFPHSLIESLVADKPVLVSEQIPMADYVRKQNCGVVVEDVSVASVTTAIEILKSRYPEFARNTTQIGPDAFSISGLLENHRNLYGM